MYPADLDEAGARLRVIRMTEAARAGRGIRYAVEEDGVALGTAGFGASDQGYEVFYALKPEGRGRGLATGSVLALVRWLAAQGQRAVRLSTLDGNTASEAVARRAGFRRERKGTHVDGRPLTVWLRVEAPTTPE
jgi:RimJ/RimL family protein N-acetyltransferase